MKTMRQAAVYALIVLACMSSAAWQPEPASDWIDGAVLLAHGASLLDLETPPMP